MNGAGLRARLADLLEGSPPWRWLARHQRNLAVKWLTNNLVNGTSGLPNLAVNLTVQLTLDLGLHLSGAYPVLAYLAGTFCSMQVSALWGMLTHTRFRVGSRVYHYSHKDEPEEPERGGAGNG